MIEIGVPDEEGKCLASRSEITVACWNWGSTWVSNDWINLCSRCQNHLSCHFRACCAWRAALAPKLSIISRTLGASIPERYGAIRYKIGRAHVGTPVT